MSTYERLAELPLEIESYDLEGLSLRFSPEFVRETTLIKLRGGRYYRFSEPLNYGEAEP